MAERSTDGTSAAAIGARLRLTREVVGISQSELADKCGIARNTYNQYETGKNIPQLDKAIVLCRELSLTLDWIYLGDPSGFPYRLADLIKSKRAHQS